MVSDTSANNQSSVDCSNKDSINWYFAIDERKNQLGCIKIVGWGTITYSSKMAPSFDNIIV
ncbi:MAG: hypothetical protein PHW45_04485 [Candidatus ainarchaeum sp.]|nr:hypothetical protein [Candidatus ainarchaeum sp.]